IGELDKRDNKGYPHNGFIINDLSFQWHNKKPVDKRSLSLSDTNSDFYMVKKAFFVIKIGIVDASGAGF
ncbi:hypothetical protein SM098_003115, partial [Cronobacter sakazakii]|nr:hypothetical protein [Cronobacter sakazakii]